MHTPTVTPYCGHPRHVGTCANCQRRAKLRAAAQLAAAQAAAQAWAAQRAHRTAQAQQPLYIQRMRRLPTL